MLIANHERLMFNPRLVTVVGLGVSGLSCARYFNRAGDRVTVIDSRSQPPMLDQLMAEDDAIEFLNLPLDQNFPHGDLLVVSPGVSLAEPGIQAAIDNQVPVVGDVEIFAQHAVAPILAITGSNGKSTVTRLTTLMAEAAGLSPAEGGNIGTPVLDLLEQPTPGCYVLELSSFQLETTSSLSARAAVVLNISPDHMDRYPNMQAYVDAKARIYRQAQTVILNRDDTQMVALNNVDDKAVSIGSGKSDRDQDFGLEHFDGETWLMQGQQRLLAASELKLSGPHNLLNIQAALALLTTCTDITDTILDAARQFSGLAHRYQWLAEHNGVCWINDSKATNVSATIAALQGSNRPTVLIAGGDAKGADFSELTDVIHHHARAVVLMGRDAKQIAAVIKDVRVEYARDMEQAVESAASLAELGDCVLLSPACASFDMYQNFEQRGDVYCAAVERWVRNGQS